MTTPIVLDASVTVNWLVEDEDEPAADAAFAALDHVPGIAPRVWDFEVRNVLLMLHRKGRLTAAEFRRLFGSLQTAPVSVDDDADLSSTLVLAEKHGLTFYDALYLELALRRGATLATTDRKLVAAAIAENVLFEA